MSHLKRGSVDTDLVRSFLFPVPAGVIAASVIAARISGDSLKFIFAAVAVVVAVKLLFGRASWKLGTQIPGNPLRAVIGFFIGFLSTFMGIGGGIFNNTFMTLYGRQMLQSVATSCGRGRADLGAGRARLHLGRLGCAGAAAAVAGLRQCADDGGGHSA